MSSDFLGDRKQALEDSFFRLQDSKLKSALREKQEAAEHKKALAAASSITDEAMLDHLVSLDIHANTLAALTLIPLVEVAWADGKVHGNERDEILAAAAEHGVAAGTESHDLLTSWLDSPPDRSLLAAWKEYVTAVSASLDTHARIVLREQLLARSRAVAEAAGGVLGIASVSPGEKSKLDELAAAFGD